MTASWVGATHSIKLLYLRHPLAGFGYHSDLFPRTSLGALPLPLPLPHHEDVLSPHTVHPLSSHRNNASTTAIHNYLLVG